MIDPNEVSSIFKRRRSIRRFQQKPVPFSILKECVNCARFAPSGKNLQLLEYIVVTDSSLRARLFSHLHWAGYLSSWEPSKNEQPMAYTVIISKKSEETLTAYDVGIASAHLVLFAEANEIGSCILLNVDKSDIERILEIPTMYQLDAVIAFGYKKDQPIIETDDHNKKYWLDEKQVLHIPKRSLGSILHNQTF